MLIQAGRWHSSIPGDLGIGTWVSDSVSTGWSHVTGSRAHVHIGTVGERERVRGESGKVEGRGVGGGESGRESRNEGGGREREG